MDQWSFELAHFYRVNGMEYTPRFQYYVGECLWGLFTLSMSH